MDELKPYLDTEIPEWVLLSSFFVMSIAIVALFCVGKDFEKTKKMVLLTMLTEYVAMVLASTVVFRETSEEYRLMLQPFYSYDMSESTKSIIWEVLMNLVLFVPIGLMLRGVIVSCWKVVAGGCFLSLSIEVQQLLFRKGLCETDDLIHNTLGALIGCLLYMGIVRCLKAISIRIRLSM